MSQKAIAANIICNISFHTTIIAVTNMVVVVIFTNSAYVSFYLCLMYKCMVAVVIVVVAVSPYLEAYGDPGLT